MVIPGDLNRGHSAIPISNTTLIPLLLGLIYAIIISVLAYRESGKLWMLLFPHWIDARSGVSSRLRRHGCIAFALLLGATGLFFYDLG